METHEKVCADISSSGEMSTGVCMDAMDALAANHGLFSECFVVPSEQASLGTMKVPEVSLFRAMLERGVEDLFFQSANDPGGAAKIRRDTKKWLMSDNTEDVFAFITLCDMFHIDGKHFRQGLLNLLSKGLTLKIEKED